MPENAEIARCLPELLTKLTKLTKLPDIAGDCRRLSVFYGECWQLLQSDDRCLKKYLVRVKAMKPAELCRRWLELLTNVFSWIKKNAF